MVDSDKEKFIEVTMTAPLRVPLTNLEEKIKAVCEKHSIQLIDMRVSPAYCWCGQELKYPVQKDEQDYK